MESVKGRHARMIVVIELGFPLLQSIVFREEGGIIYGDQVNDIFVTSTVSLKNVYKKLFGARLFYHDLQMHNITPAYTIIKNGPCTARRTLGNLEIATWDTTVETEHCFFPEKNQRLPRARINRQQVDPANRIGSDVQHGGIREQKRGHRFSVITASIFPVEGDQHSS